MARSMGRSRKAVCLKELTEERYGDEERERERENES